MMREPEFGTPLFNYWLRSNYSYPRPIAPHCNCGCYCMRELTPQHMPGILKCDPCNRGIHMPVTPTANLYHTFK